MKKRSLITKLALSGVALAATAATLATSTYAWYTTNTSVEANKISGASADSSDASVFISANGGTNWYQKLDGTSNGNDKITINGSSLLPVTVDTDGNWVDQKSASVISPSVYTFTLSFKTSKTSEPVKLGIHSISVENTSGAKQAENILTGEEYKVDILNSLAFKMESGTETDLTKTAYSLTPGNGCIGGTVDSTATGIQGQNAHEYVNAVVAGSVSNTVTKVTNIFADKVVIATLPADGSQIDVKFTIFLDGADVDCYDACKGQTFTVNFNFAVITDSKE